MNHPTSPTTNFPEKLVSLNHARATEESRGLIRYLRPHFQNSASPSPSADLTGPVPRARRKTFRAKS